MRLHTLLGAAALGMAVFAGGCQNKPKEPAPVPTPAPSSSDGAASPVDDADRPRPDTMDAQAETADMIAQKTATYAHNLESLLAKRPAEAAQRSQVEWMKADELRLTPVPPVQQAPAPTGATALEPQVLPVIESEPTTANQVASLSPQRPQLVPTAATMVDAPVAAQPEADSGPEPVNVSQLERKLRQQIKDYPRDIAGHLDYQLLRFVNDEQVPELSTIAALPTEDREMLTALLDGLSNFRNTVRADNNMLLSRKIRPLIQLGDRLRHQADLSIGTVALCTRVDGYGIYQPIEPARFIAGREHQAIIYCEVENFASQLNDKQMWETRLKQEAVLYTETGLPVWDDRTKSITDVCRNRRHDFFLVKMIKLPANLTIGRYLLKMTIVDEQASRVAEATLPIQVVAQ